jgi:hypothetical protein
MKIVKYFVTNQDRLTGLMFLVALVLIVTMAAKSGFNAHPDEYVHVAAAKYYQTHWLPPAVSNPEIRNSFSVYGHSRLTELNLVYFFAGKFSVPAGYFVKDPVLALRLFNCLLFLALAILFFKESRETKPLFLVLLISPQIWYVFSYFNSDAFGLFLTFIITLQLIKEKIIFNQFLHAASATGGFKGALFMALLLALQIYSKSNYYLILIFFAILMLIEFIKRKERRKSMLYKGLLLAALTVLLLAPRYLYDVTLHGFNRNMVIAEYREKYAGDQYKRSQINQSGISPGPNLRNKGIKYAALFSDPLNWHIIIAMSFFGVYGYMSILGPKLYYVLMVLLFSILLAWMTIRSIKDTSLPQKIPPLIFYLLFLLILYLASNFAWTKDFQGQGRFLFPVLSILGFWFTEFLKFNKPVFLKMIMVMMFLAGTYSFIFVALTNIPQV